MRLAILGATGGTGQQLLQQALATGYQVMAIVRRPAARPGCSMARAGVITGSARWASWLRRIPFLRPM